MSRITKEEARAIALAAQGLHVNSFGKGKSGALNAVKHLGYIQLDTLSVVTRAHHHTLWTRADEYAEAHLNQLVKEKKIFEYWSHAAAYLPIEDFRFSLVRKEAHRKGESHWFKKNKKIMQYVLDRIKAEGPLQSRDFETDKVRGAWWDWKPAKVALEQLFHDGTLMVSERKGFQKVYDLTENILPSKINTQTPTKEEYARHLIENTLKAHGLASIKEITHLRRGTGPIVQEELKKMLREGQVEEMTIDKVKDKYIILPSTRNPKPVKHEKAVLLSPFDNVVIMRHRLKNLFEYDYGIECYVPEPKRKFGYFCLPILYGDQFVGRMDPKADREKQVFYVKRLHLEHPPKNMQDFLQELASAIRRFAIFNSCKRMVVEKTHPGGKIKQTLNSFLR